MNTNRRLSVCLIVSLLGITTPAFADLITNSPNLPPPAGQYVSPQDAHQIYAGVPIELWDISHYGFTHVITEKDPGNQQLTHETFDSLLSGQVHAHDGTLLSTFTGVPAQVKVDVLGPGPLGPFSTEMTQLNMTLGGVMIRESPTLSSVGQTTITDLGGGQFQIHSFFDVFTEISLDGGQTWNPSTQAGRVNLTGIAPEPASLPLAAMPLLGSFGYLLRRRFAK